MKCALVNVQFTDAAPGEWLFVYSTSRIENIDKFWIEEEISPNPGEKLPADLLTNTAQWTPEVSGNLLSHFGKTKTQVNDIREFQSQMQNILFPGVADWHSCRSDGVRSEMHPGIIPQGNLYTGISHHWNMHLGKNVFKDRDTLLPLDQLVKASTCVLKVQFMRFVSYTRNRIITISKVLFLFAFTLESTYVCRSLVLRIILALL